MKPINQRLTKRVGNVKVVRPDLRSIAGVLNNLASTPDGAMKEAWTKAEAIISIVAEAPTKAESLDRAIAAFKALRRDCPVFLDLIRRGKEIERTATPPAGDDLGHVLWILWWVYFPREGRERLKRCRLAECRKWFVDETKSNTQLQCSTACKWRYWSWSKRREEGHHPAPRKRE